MKIVVNIDVPALAPAIDFYTLALGLFHARTLDNDVAELVGADCVLYLLEKPAGSAATSSEKLQPSPRRYERHWTPVHVDFVVDDITSAAVRAESAGAARESGCIEWRGSKCITFSDPFGNGFCLLELTGGTYAS